MSRAETVTKLPLAEFFRIMGVHPLHAAGVQLTALQTSPNCAQPWLQHEWQDTDRVSREEVARAIAQAESDIEAQLSYRLLPTWVEDERCATFKPYRPEVYLLNGVDLRGQRQSVWTNWKKAISGGVRSQELIGRGADTIVWSDADGDGYDETGTVIVVTTALNACELRLFYPGKSGDERWEIRPIYVVLGGGSAVITFRRELCVLESILESMLAPRAADGADDADFLTTVDVYRVYNDPQRQAQMLWNPNGGGCGCSSTSLCSCSYGAQYACLAFSDFENGQVTYGPATWNATTLAFDAADWALAQQPDQLRLWYYAGLRDLTRECPDLQMRPDWARAVAYYAASMLDRPLCDCNPSFFANWQQDLAFESGATEIGTYRISPRVLDNPFGTRRGAIYAWERVQRPGAMLNSAVAVR